MVDLKDLSVRLAKLGLTAVPSEDANRPEFKRLNRKVGDLKLYGLARSVNEAMETLGYAERVTEGKYRSRFAPEMLVDPLVKFCECSKFMPKDKKVLDRAIASVAKKFCKGTTSPISLKDAYDRLIKDKADHFAGLPTLGKKGDDAEALTRAEHVFDGACPPPTVILHRGKNTEVARVVQCYPFEMHIVEAAFYFPLYDLIYQRQSIYPVGPLAYRRYTMRKWISTGKYNTKFSIDYSGFDASVNSKMIGIAWEVMSKMLKLDAQEQKVWDRIRIYFSTSPFLAPDGMVYKGRKGGVPSGSMFTQMVDSICNAVALEYAMQKEGVKDYRYLVYGDDSWTVCHIDEEPRSFLEKLETHVRSLGLRMNVDKTAYAKPDQLLVFCGHYDIKRGRPLQDAIDKLVYPERPSEALTTRDGIAERLIAYIADADCPALNAVYIAVVRQVPVRDVILNGTTSYLHYALETHVKSNNRRHLPGIMQVLEVEPKFASSLMKMRAAL